MSEKEKKLVGNYVILTCRCGSTETVPAYEDKGALKPVAPYPRICLGCWLDGWRSRGPLPGGTWEIYHDPAQVYRTVRM